MQVQRIVRGNRVKSIILLVNGLASFLGRLRQKTASLLEVIRGRMTLSFTCLCPFQILLLDGFFQSFFRTLIHTEIIQEKI